MEDTEKLTLSVAEAAERIGVCELHLRNQIKAGKFPCVLRMGRRVLIPKLALEKYLTNIGNAGACPAK